MKAHRERVRSTRPTLNGIEITRAAGALRFLAADDGLSQEKLASRAGYSPSAISRRLSAETPLTVDDLAMLAGALGYEVTVTFSETTEYRRVVVSTDHPAQAVESKGHVW